VDQQQVESVRFQWEWRLVGNVTLRGEDLIFPTQVRFPGIYRIILVDQKGSVAVYVGESQSIADRFQQYRNASPRRSGTTYKVNDEVYFALASGGHVNVDVIRSAHLLAQSGTAVALDLSVKHARRMIEAAVLLNLAEQDVRVINAD
jgi:hypothetical protein